jgi:hypothetical protein
MAAAGNAAPKHKRKGNHTISVGVAAVAAAPMANVRPSAKKLPLNKTTMKKDPKKATLAALTVARVSALAANDSTGREVFDRDPSR